MFSPLISWEWSPDVIVEFGSDAVHRVVMFCHSKSKVSGENSAVNLTAFSLL